MKLLISICAILMILHVNAQKISLDHFDKGIYNCQFNSADDAKIWPSMNTSSDMVLIQNENYVIQRKDNSKGKMIFPDYSNLYQSYELHIKLELNNDIASGICFGFNSDRTIGFVLDINGKQEYRIRKLTDKGTYTYITGSKENNSWKKFKLLEKSETTNDINILVIDDLVEVYFNSFFAFSFENKLSHDYRDFGFSLNPQSNITVKEVNLMINSDEEAVDPDHPKTVISDNESTSKYLEKIVTLNNELTKTQEEIEKYLTMLEKCKDDNDILTSYITNNLNITLQDKIDVLEKQNESLKKTIGALTSENNSLQEFKDFYMNSSKDTDIINFLYDELHKLEKENAQLKEQLK